MSILLSLTNSHLLPCTHTGPVPRTVPDFPYLTLFMLLALSLYVLLLYRNMPELLLSCKMHFGNTNLTGIRQKTSYLLNKKSSLSDTLFSFSIFVHAFLIEESCQHLELFNIPFTWAYKGFVARYVFALAFVGLSLLCLYLIGYGIGMVYQEQTFHRLYFRNLKERWVISSIFITPILFLLPHSPSASYHILFFIFLIIVVAFHFLSNLQLIITGRIYSGFSLLHNLLYLCTLETTIFWTLWKALNALAFGNQSVA